MQTCRGCVTKTWTEVSGQCFPIGISVNYYDDEGLECLQTTFEYKGPLEQTRFPPECFKCQVLFDR